jgi:hypothetical protein
MILRSLKQSEGLDKRKLKFVGSTKSINWIVRPEKQRFKAMIFGSLLTQARGLLPLLNTNDVSGILGLRNRLAHQS